MTFVVLAPEHPLVDGRSPPTEHRAEVDGLRRAGHAASPTSSASRPRAARTSGASSPAPTPSTRSPASRCPIYLADYVLMTYGTGAIMAVPGRGPAGLGLRHGLRPADRPHRRSRPTGWEGEAYTGDGPAINSEWLDGMTDTAEAKAAAIDWLEERGHRRAQGQLPPAGLAAVPPALLGLPDPGGLLPDRRHRPGARGPAAGAAARRRRVPADRRVAAALPRGVPAHHLPRCAAARPSARPTPWTPSSTRRGTSCASATRGPTDAPVDLAAADAVDARRPVHRRDRARHPAPALRPLLHPGPGRPGAGAEGRSGSRSTGCSPRA